MNALMAVAMLGIVACANVDTRPQGNNEIDCSPPSAQCPLITIAGESAK
jgi:hypothetical protein